MTRKIKKFKHFVYALVRYIFHHVGDEINPPDSYELVFHDQFNTFDKSKWNLGMHYGNFHPEHLQQHYDSTGKFVYTQDNTLVLESCYYPKSYVKSLLPDGIKHNHPNLPEKFVIPNTVGVIHSKDTFQYGWFEAKIKLPEGKNLWPAFWLTSINTWPPEIDIIEGYSNVTKKFAKKLFGINLNWWKFQPNIHYGTDLDGNHKTYGAINIPIKIATRRYVQYVLHWEKDFIRIYYDGYLVLEETDINVLEWFNSDMDQMIVIIGTGILPDTNRVSTSKFKVSEVNIYQNN